MKAKYIRRSEDGEYVYLTYLYRGHEYEVYIHKTKKSEPLTWQHKNEQTRIDNLKERAMVDMPETIQESLDWFFDSIC